ncbi:BlaI/MecI/CopY family transcriptional regulator [bacterium]|nr:BlaI/MecI/CopY family transcriptional regulator [bacterium]
MTKKLILHKRELQIMKIIWESGQATVRDIYETLLKKERIAYTTVSTMVNSLEEKGFLRHDVDGRTYIYKPLVAQEEVSQGMLQDLLERLFDGSTEMLLNTLIKVKNLNQDDLEQLWQRVALESEENNE